MVLLLHVSTAANLIVLHLPNRRLCSNTADNPWLYKLMLRTKKYGGHAFSSCVPMCWTDLPLDVQSPLIYWYFWIIVDFKTVFYLNYLWACKSSTLYLVSTLQKIIVEVSLDPKLLIEHWDFNDVMCSK